MKDKGVETTVAHLALSCDRGVEDSNLRVILKPFAEPLPASDAAD